MGTLSEDLNRPLIYVASPYSAPTKEGMFEKFEKVTEFTGLMVQRGHVAISLVTYAKTIMDYQDLPDTFEFWETLSLTVLRKCDRLLVLKLEGWETSKGVTAEIGEAERLGMPVSYMDEPVVMFSKKRLAAYYEKFDRDVLAAIGSMKVT